MARIRAEQQLNTLVNHKQFMRTLKMVGKLAPSRGTYPMICKAGLVEVSNRFQTISITTTDLTVGTTIDLPCFCHRDESAVVDLSPESIRAMSGHADLLGTSVKLELDGGKVSCGGIPFGKEGVSPEDWPPAWTREGMSKESMSDVFLVDHSDFFEAACAVFPSARVNEDSRSAIEHLHVRRTDFDWWQMESTDGHRAATCKKSGVLTRDLILRPGMIKAYFELSGLAPKNEPQKIRMMTFNADVDALSAGSLSLQMHLDDDGVAYVVTRNPFFTWTIAGTISSFPPLEKVIPKKENCYTFTFCPKDLSEAARAIIDLARIKRPKNGDSFDPTHAAVLIRDEEDHKIYLRHEPSGRQFVISHDSGWIARKGDEEVPPSCKTQFNSFYMFDAAAMLSRSKMATAWFNSDPKLGDPLMLEDGVGGMTLIMPIRG